MAVALLLLLRLLLVIIYSFILNLSNIMFSRCPLSTVWSKYGHFWLQISKKATAIIPNSRLQGVTEGLHLTAKLCRQIVRCVRDNVFCDTGVQTQEMAIVLVLGLCYKDVFSRILIYIHICR